MATISILQIADAIENTLKDSSGIRRSESMDELGEGIPDLPLLQVYWAGFVKSEDSQTDRIGFGDATNQPIRHTLHRFFVDIVTKARSELAEDFLQIAVTAEAVDTVLETQNGSPYFGLEGIKAFRYEVEPLNWENTEPQAKGMRFILYIHVF